MSKNRSRLKQDLDAEDRIDKLLGQRSRIDVGAPVTPDTRLRALVATAGQAIGRYMPPVPQVMKVAIAAPVEAIASDHHGSTIGDAYVAQEEAEVELPVAKPNRKQPSSTMRHRRNH